jgi:IS5 family transposase
MCDNDSIAGSKALVAIAAVDDGGYRGVSDRQRLHARGDSLLAHHREQVARDRAFPSSRRCSD